MKPWRVLVTATVMKDVGEEALRKLREAGCEVIMPPAKDRFTAAEVAQLLPGVDAVLASSEPYSREVIASSAASDLKIISRWGVGYDAIDIAAATEAGICVAYTPGLLNETVADYAFALLCAVARRVHEGHLEMRQKIWRKLWGFDISGRTLGLVGCGRIGLAMARRASGFQMRVVACDPVRNAEAERMGITYVSLPELLAGSDFVSLHMALSAQTRGLIGYPQLQQMKRTACLINTARGPMIDEPALARALKEGLIGGAALDVFATEPLPADHVFYETPNLLLAPHQASCTWETGAKLSNASADAILDLMNGRRPRWLVAPEVLDSAGARVKVGA
jgi:phosphoglycerate dehydrogenase-like enzyme